MHVLVESNNGGALECFSQSRRQVRSENVEQPLCLWRVAKRPLPYCHKEHIGIVYEGNKTLDIRDQDGKGTGVVRRRCLVEVVLDCGGELPARCPHCEQPSLSLMLELGVIDVIINVTIRRQGPVRARWGGIGGGVRCRWNEIFRMGSGGGKCGVCNVGM